MRINFFEGARRILRLMQAAWVIACIVLTWNERPYVSFVYSTAGPSATFTPVENCGSPADREYLPAFKLAEGKYASGTLCFVAQEFTDGSFIPYTASGDRLWFGPSYSREVAKYKQARAERFILPEDARKRLLSEWRERRWGQISDAAVRTVAGAIALSVLASIIGWIVRGFFGIPRGCDRRPDPPGSAMTNGSVL